MKKPRKCPYCGAGQIIPIVYGLPNNDLRLEAEKGLIYLGGCCVDESNPEWYCKLCKKQFGGTKSL